MKKYLLASALATVAFAIPTKSKASGIVFDPTNYAESILEFNQAVAAVAQLKAQLQQLSQTYSMFTQQTNVMGMAQGLQNPMVENPMPPTSALPGMLSGQSGLSGEGAYYYQQNHIYSPPAASPYATLSSNNAESIANIQGIASNNLAAVQTRLQQIPQLEADLNSAYSITQVSAIHARIAAESQFVQAQQDQAANLQVLAQEQQASNQQQQIMIHFLCLIR